MRTRVAEVKAIVERRPGSVLAAILVVGFLVRLPWIAVNTHTSNDLEAFISWTRGIQAHGLTRAYDTTDVNYGPLAVYLLAAAGFLQAHLGGGDRVLIALIKLPSIAADVLAAALLFWALRRRPGAGAALPLLACALYLFNPAIWFVSARWGQSDSVYAVFLLAAVIALERGAVVLAWAAYTLSMTHKLVGIAFAPLLVVWTLSRYGPRALANGVVAAAATATVVLSPWLVTGRIGGLVHHAYLAPTSEPPRVDVSGYNLWYLLFGGRVRTASSHSDMPLLGIQYQTVGFVLFAVFVLVVVMLAVRRSDNVIVPAAALAAAPFMLLTQVHERYLFPAVALVLLAAASRTADVWWEYGLLSLAFLFNLVSVASFAPFIETNLVAATADSPHLVVLKALALAAAAVNLVILVRLAGKAARFR